MTPHHTPLIGLFSLGNQGNTYRGLPAEAIATGFDGWAKSKVLPAVAATGARRLFLHLPGGYAPTDEPQSVMSFRTWALLNKYRCADGRVLTDTMDKAIGTITPAVDEVIVYLGGIVASMSHIASTNPRAFLGLVCDCLGPFFAYPKVSLALDASADFTPDSPAENLFQLLRSWVGNKDQRLKVYREGAPNQQYPAQWRDPGYITWESYSLGQATPNTWYPDETKLTDELVVQQPNNPLVGRWGDDPKEAWLTDWVDRTTHAGYSACVGLSSLIAAGVNASRWTRTIQTPNSEVAS